MHALSGLSPLSEHFRNPEKISIWCWLKNGNVWNSVGKGRFGVKGAGLVGCRIVEL